MKEIGKMLKKARENIGKTQQQIADEAEVSRAYYADVERGRYTPSLKLLSRLGNLLNIDLNFLKENDGNTSI
ncbi:helix-turn-helix transcriptional regulator [Megasphaera paucivorans]|uniref:DNA-binding transcriptional regulator, XRE-family HTH domain n=1 Tax=Megasphaera paucivorans TaxID=349095 RepID=A0A1G9QFE0_9FIRM|nr:helix-turn-helix transcriptional regulator [Megasphaera paucivorans]SDM09610.1 DNA-binding transcriptional regulator, XRE-family HTH domain [Megasphaera paucivorans]